MLLRKKIFAALSHMGSETCEGRSERGSEVKVGSPLFLYLPLWRNYLIKHAYPIALTTLSLFVSLFSLPLSLSLPVWSCYSMAAEVWLGCWRWTRVVLYSCTWFLPNTSFCIRGQTQPSSRPWSFDSGINYSLHHNDGICKCRSHPFKHSATPADKE